MLEKFKTKLRRKNRIRAKISWTALRPRLSVCRSNIWICAQIIDDVSWQTLCASSDLKIKNWTKTQKATKVWEDIALKAKSLKISNIVFDRGWVDYHGRVKALADAARTTWLKF